MDVGSTNVENPKSIIELLEENKKHIIKSNLFKQDIENQANFG